MKRYIVLCISLIASIIYIHAEDSIKVSASDMKALIERIERLEQAQAHPYKRGEVDAYTGATRRVQSTEHSNNRVQNDSVKVERESVKVARRGRLTLGGYGEVTAKYAFYSNNYLRYVSPDKYRNRSFGEFDLPHITFFLGYDFGKGWSVGCEIEFEHSGVEVAVEKEEKEGGAEYEQEVERGGEVAIEQFWLQKKFNDYAILRAGMQIVPVGGLNAHHEPTEYFGVYRPEGEYTILPSTWREISLSFIGKTPFGLHYQAMFMPGLDADRFGRKNWIKGGAASPYEFKIANVFAGAARVDYIGVKGLRLSLSGYCGNSFRNNWDSRTYSESYKNVKGTVAIGSFDFAFKDYNLILRGNVTYGHLGDAAKISEFNAHSLMADQTTVASDVMACGIEAGYDFFSLNHKLVEKKQKFYLFGRYDWYDSQFRRNGEPTQVNAFCGRQRFAVGINYYPIEQIGIKAEGSYAILKKGAYVTYNDEPMVAFGIVYNGIFKL